MEINKEKKQKDRSSIPKTIAPDIPKKRYCIANLQGVGRRSRQEASFSTTNAFDEEKITAQCVFPTKAATGEP